AHKTYAASGTVMRPDYRPGLCPVRQRLRGWPPATAADADVPRTPAAEAEAVQPRGFYQRRDRQAFPDLYAEIDREMFGGARRAMGRAITGPITYTGHAALRADIDNLHAALEGSGATEAVMTAVAPGSFGREQNRYYRSQEEFLFAIADAMRVEYREIVDAGFVLQIDDPGMAENWDAMDPSVTVEQYREYARMCIAALNHGLEGIPRSR